MSLHPPCTGKEATNAERITDMNMLDGEKAFHRQRRGQGQGRPERLTRRHFSCNIGTPFMLVTIADSNPEPRERVGRA